MLGPAPKLSPEPRGVPVFFELLPPPLGKIAIRAIGSLFFTEERVGERAIQPRDLFRNIYRGDPGFPWFV